MLRRLLPYLLILLALASLKTNALADPTHCGVGFYFGPTCPAMNCSPNPWVPSAALNISIPYGNGNYGYVTAPAGWLDYNIDADKWGSSCSNPSEWSTTGILVDISYNDGEVSYSGKGILDAAVIDTSYTGLPSGDTTCWKCEIACTSFPPLMYHPLKFFIRKLKVQSCTTYSHVRTNKFIASGCDGYTVPTFVNDPYCPNMNSNYINLTVTGAP